MPFKFSIVLPCFNSASYIQEALNSLFFQTFQNFELIVIDGGSSDETLEILESNRDRINILVSEPDDGQSDAFNKGFALATGEFYLWLNADDLLMPQFLENAAKFLDDNNSCRWLACHTVFIDKLGYIRKFHHAPPWISYLNINHRPQVECPTSIFHRDLFLEAGGFDLRLHYSMDLDLWRTFVKNGHQWSRLDYYGYIFRIHDGSKTNKETVPVNSSPDEISQGEIMRTKHNIKYKKSSILLSKILKLYHCAAYSLSSQLRWRSVHISSYIAKYRT
jgi:glycosyltransferase involved in cell wall biosynthesis